MATYTWADLRRMWPTLSQYERLDKARAAGHTVIRPGYEGGQTPDPPKATVNEDGTVTFSGGSSPPPPTPPPSNTRGGGATGTHPLSQAQVQYRGEDGQLHTVNHPDIQAEIARLQKTGRNADAHALIRAADRYEDMVSQQNAEIASQREEDARNAADLERVTARRNAMLDAVARATGITREQLNNAIRANGRIMTILRRMDAASRSGTAGGKKRFDKEAEALSKIRIYGKKINYANPSGDTQWMNRRDSLAAAGRTYYQHYADPIRKPDNKKLLTGGDDDAGGTTTTDGGTAGTGNGNAGTGNGEGGEKGGEEEEEVPRKVKQTVKQQIMNSPVFNSFLTQLIESTGITTGVSTATKKFDMTAGERRTFMNNLFTGDFRSKIADLLVARRSGLGSKAYTDAYDALRNIKLGDTGKKFLSTQNLQQALNQAGLGVAEPTEYMQRFLNTLPGVDGADPTRTFGGLAWLKGFNPIYEDAAPTTGIGQKWLTIEEVLKLSPEKMAEYANIAEMMGDLGYPYLPGGAIERETPIDFGAEGFDPTKLSDPRQQAQYLEWKAFQDKVNPETPETIDWATFDPSTATNAQLKSMLDRQTLLNQIEELRGDGPEAGQGTDAQPIMSPNVNPDSPFTQVSPQGTGGYVDSAQAGWQTSDQFNPLYQPDHMNAENNLHGGRIGGRY